MKFKDYVTMGNLVGGFAAVIALFHDRFDLACYLIFLAYVFDVLDGVAARVTKQYDTFGEHFDTACDFITNSICAGFIVYYAFANRAGYPWWAAAILGAFPVVFGTIRQARGADRPLSYPCYWLGVPRPVAALFIVAMLKSTLVTGTSPAVSQVAYGVAAVLVVVLSYLHLSTLPFSNHKARRWLGPMRFGVWFFLGGSPVAFFVSWLVLGRPELIFDYLTFSLFMYIFVSWTQIPRADLDRIRAYLDGGDVEKPLVHVDSTWRPSSLAPYFERD